MRGAIRCFSYLLLFASPADSILIQYRTSIIISFHLHSKSSFLKRLVARSEYILRGMLCTSCSAIAHNRLQPCVGMWWYCTVVGWFHGMGYGQGWSAVVKSDQSWQSIMSCPSSKRVHVWVAALQAQTESGPICERMARPAPFKQLLLDQGAHRHDRHDRIPRVPLIIINSAYPESFRWYLDIF